jgi:hypothetical protein
MHSTSGDIFKWVARFFGFTLGSLVLLSAYWILIDRQPPIDIRKGEVVRYTQKANGDWLLLVKWTAFRHRTCPGISRRWISGEVWLPLPDIMYPPQLQKTGPGEFVWEVVAEIPEYIRDLGGDEGQYTIDIKFACNPLQQYVFPITVTPGPVDYKIPSDDRIRP